MAIFTKQFPNADEYEKWYQEAKERISVLSITNLPATHGSSTQPTAGPIAIKYKTDDPLLAPARNMTAMVAQVVIVAALFFALFLYLISIL